MIDEHSMVNGMVLLFIGMNFCTELNLIAIVLFCSRPLYSRGDLVFVNDIFSKKVALSQKATALQKEV